MGVEETFSLVVAFITSVWTLMGADEMINGTLYSTLP